MVAPVFLRPDHNVFRIKALTLYNPWAWFVIMGLKRFETRSWRPNNLQIGDLFVIHAGKRFSGEERVYCQRELIKSALSRHGILDPKKQLPFGAALGIVKLISVRRTEDVRDLITHQEQALGNFANKRFAWELEVVKAFEKPVSLPGAQGIFTIEFDRNPMLPKLEIITGGRDQPESEPTETEVMNFHHIKHRWNPKAQRFDDARYVYCGRRNSTYNTPQSIWHNPFKGPGAIEKFRSYLLLKPDLLSRLDELRGKKLVCWCKPDNCHCDVLVDLLSSNDYKNESVAPAPVRLLDAATPLIPVTDDELKRDAAIRRYDLDLSKRLDATPAAQRRQRDSAFYQRYIHPAVMLARSLGLPTSYPVGVVNGELKRCYSAKGSMCDGRK